MENIPEILSFSFVFYVFYAYLKHLGDYDRTILKQLMLLQTYLLDVLCRFLWCIYSYATSYSNNTSLKICVYSEHSITLTYIYVMDVTISSITHVRILL